VAQEEIKKELEKPTDLKKSGLLLLWVFTTNRGHHSPVD
jgi:hypothetical protein